MSILTATRDPGWIGCIDFGTAASKAAVARALPRDEIGNDDVIPLAIGTNDDAGVEKSLLLPSVVYIDDKKVLFGREAETAAIRGERKDRHAFRSLKQYLSTHDLEDLDDTLDADVDPTQSYTPRDGLILFLAHLLERAGQSAKERDVPWPVRLRIARPAWKVDRAARGEQELKAIVRRAFALVDILGKRLVASGGLEHKAARKALEKSATTELPDDERLFVMDANGGASVLEASAVAAGSVRELDRGRRVVAVADIGGGTSDFGVFMTGVPGMAVLAEIEGSARALGIAGDHLDMLLRDHVLRRRGLRDDDPAGRGPSNSIRRRQRDYKERLFRQGTVVIDVIEPPLRLKREDFLADEHVRQFAADLGATFEEVHEVAIACARAYPPPTGGRTPVEILLTGGGHELPMVRAFYEDRGGEWNYEAPAPDLIERPEDLDFAIARRQLVVAIGGALRDLPTLVRPVHLPATHGAAQTSS